MEVNLCVCAYIQMCVSTCLVENTFHLLQAKPQTFSANLQPCNKCDFNFTDTYLTEPLLYVQK